MDEALFARRALGVQGKAGPRKATGAHQQQKQQKQTQEQQGDKYEPTPDEMIEMMKLMRDAGLADGPPDVPEKIEDMMAKVKRQQQRQRQAGADIALPGGKAPPPSASASASAAAAAALAPPPAAIPQQRVRSFVPSAWMVLKTSTTAPCGPPLPEDKEAARRPPYPAGYKVFVNVCYSVAVPPPAAWSKQGDERGQGGGPDAPPPPSDAAAAAAASSSSALPPGVEAALDRWTQEDDASSEALRVPLSCGPLRTGCDRRGDPCAVADVVFSRGVARAAERHKPLRAFLVSLALEWVGSKYRLDLDLGGFRFPRMAYKKAAGETGIAEQRLVLAARDLVSEIPSAAASAAAAAGGGGGGGGGGSSAAAEAPTEAAEAAATSPEKGARGGGAGDGGVDAAQKPEEERAGSPRAAAAGAAAAATATAATAAAAAAPARRATKPPSAAAAAPLPFAVSFEGSPVTTAVVRFELPALPGPDPSSLVRVLVSGAAGRVRVSLAAAAEADAATTTAAADVRLPFSVSAARSSARLAPDGRSVTVRLPWVPVKQVLQEMAADEKEQGGGQKAGAAAAAALASVVAELA